MSSDLFCVFMNFLWHRCHSEFGCWFDVPNIELEIQNNASKQRVYGSVKLEFSIIKKYVITSLVYVYFSIEIIVLSRK